jgi:hypothetical protein
MKFMLLLKADKNTEAGVMPTAAELERMGRFNQEMIDAGVLVDGAGLKPTSQGARITWRDGKPIVTDGPFAETKELVAGYWMIDVKSKDEAIAWARRVPFDMLPNAGDGPQIEVRPLFGLEDFDNLPDFVRRQEENWPSQAGQK